jgi:hypothetical protein
MWDALIPPSDLELTETERGLLLKGPAHVIDDFCRIELRRLASLGHGCGMTCGTWRLMVSDHIVEPPLLRTIAIPAGAWNIAASVLADVAYGEYDSPFYFGDVGFLQPPPEPDIGVELAGQWIGQSEGIRGVSGRRFEPPAASG